MACSKATACCKSSLTSTSGTVGKAFGWTDAETRDELSHVHLSNLPENLSVLQRHDRFRRLVLRHLSVVGPRLWQS